MLVKAKQEGLVPAVAPLVKELLEKGFRLSRKLADEVLVALGEPPL